ncbi:MAG: F0F1 ATP synthase subunit A [Candidatus Gracilibacteria bacterium]|nr:F0F1 ATP synthase subunit A [Candidatus Gracilibacteria bacterium]
MIKEELINIFVNSQNLILGIVFELLVVIIVAITLKYFKNQKISILISLLYEKVYLFYDGILGDDERRWVKTYVVILFFVILIANLMGIVLEFISPIFGFDEEGNFLLEHYITNPTVNLNFTLAMAIISVIFLLLIQCVKFGFKYFLLEYFPIFGKGYLTIEKGNLNKYIYFFINVIIKSFDILISMFISFLEIIGLVAKTISLSFRLFGNMIAGSILITTVIFSLSLGTKELTSSMGGISFPIILPLFVYLQELLIAFVQAFIFPMLVSIFIKTTTGND